MEQVSKKVCRFVSIMLWSANYAYGAANHGTHFGQLSRGSWQARELVSRWQIPACDRSTRSVRWVTAAGSSSGPVMAHPKALQTGM